VGESRRTETQPDTEDVMFKKATKRGAKLRCAIFGPSGSGKTFSALRIATGIGGRIAVIDTERRSASKYADRFSFDVCELGRRTVDGYITAINEARDYDVLVIDSMSHAWQELLEEVDRTKEQYGGNQWAAWSKATPKQRIFVDAILSSPCHIIATFRAKTEWTTSTENGRTKPVRVGLAPEQGKGIEYEFDLLMQLSTSHSATVIKDRTGRYQDKVIDLPDEDFGTELKGWLLDDLPPPEATPEPPPVTDEPPTPRY
jgi:hypothetical protein